MTDARDTDADGDIRILHWNIHSWRDMGGHHNASRVADLIRQTRPHAVSLVEVREPWQGSSPLTELAEACGYSQVFAPCLEIGTGAAASGYGNALLATVPIGAVEQWRVYSPDRPYDGTEPTEPRLALLASLTFGDMSIWIGSTHLPASRRGSRRGAARTLLSHVAGLEAPWLICGDFNDPPSACFGNLGAIQVTPRRVRRTYPAPFPVRRIDYCIAAPGVTADSVVLREKGSDHLPLLTTVTRVTGARLGT